MLWRRVSMALIRPDAEGDEYEDEDTCMKGISCDLVPSHLPLPYFLSFDSSSFSLSLLA